MGSSNAGRIDSLTEHDVWELTELPKERRAIKNKWIFNRKLTRTGEVDRFKARLVVTECSQEEGLDFKETFGPVMKLTTLRILLAVAAQTGQQVHQLDVKIAILNGELEEEIYMQQPEAFKLSGKEHLVCRLKRSLYELKQASRAWSQKLESHLCHQGFKREEVEHCLYVKGSRAAQILIGVYVDDMLLVSHSLDEKQNAKDKMGEEFGVKDMGEAAYILGMRITCNKESKGQCAALGTPTSHLASTYWQIHARREGDIGNITF